MSRLSEEHIDSVAGARPNSIKLAPVKKALRGTLPLQIVTAGRRYDYWMEVKAEEHERTGRGPGVLWPPEGASGARAGSLPELRARQRALDAGRSECELAGART